MQIFRREDESLVLVPRNPAASALRAVATVSLLTPTKLDAAVSFEATAPAPSDAHCGELNAVLGVIHLGDDRWPVPFIVVVTAMSVVTNVLAAPCYKITDVALLQLGGRALLSRGSAQQRAKLDSDVTSVRLLLNTGGLFVAPGIDLSRPMQEAQLHPDDPWQVRAASTCPRSEQLLQRLRWCIAELERVWMVRVQHAWADFWFNFHMAAPLRACEQAHGWIVVAIQGFVGADSLSVSGGGGSAGGSGGQRVRQASRSRSPERGRSLSSSSSLSSSAAAAVPVDTREGASSSSGSGSRSSEADDAAAVVVTLALISRRQWRRAGTRYHHRGIDDHGNVANHVETEQILRAPDGRVSSFVQVRGSAPVHFMQRHAVGKTKPTPILTNRHEVTHMAFCRHIAHVQRRFGDLVLFNLL
jgi:hypothetical protein